MTGLRDACLRLRNPDFSLPAGGAYAVRTARSGQPVLERDGISLDSPFDPLREAEKRLARLPLAGKESVILLGDGSCYLAALLVARRPELPVTVVEADPALVHAAFRARGEDAFGGFSLVLTSELVQPADIARLLPPLETACIAEHAAAGRFFPGEYGRVRELLTTVLRRRAAGLGTVAWFGRRWLHNILANMALPAPHTLEVQETGDVLLAVPGPTLPASLPLLRNRKRRFLIALAPALAYLEAEGIVPDLVVTSDGGFANLLHFCGRENGSVPLVYPLMTHEGIPRRWAGPLVPVSMGMGPEALLLREGVLPRFPECPTVALFALRLAAALGAARIFLAGQDFGQPGWRGHAPGYRFEEALFDRATRLRPVLAGLARPFREHWPEEGGFRTSVPFRLYRDGFLEAAAALGRPVRALGPAPLLLPLAAGTELPQQPLRLRVRESGRTLADPVRVAESRSRIAALARERTAPPEELLADPVLVPFLQLLRPREAFRCLEQGLAVAPEPFFTGLDGDLTAILRRLARLE